MFVGSLLDLTPLGWGIKKKSKLPFLHLTFGIAAKKRQLIQSYTFFKHGFSGFAAQLMDS